jgi:hypothetical protein
MRTEGSTNINLGIFQHTSKTIYVPSHSFSVLELRDWRIEKSTAIFGIRRTVKEDIYNADLDNESSNRAIEWSFLGRRLNTHIQEQKNFIHMLKRVR